jgi:hypothetical protein
LLKKCFGEGGEWGIGNGQWFFYGEWAMGNGFFMVFRPKNSIFAHFFEDVA